MMQVARNLTAAGDGFLRGMPYVNPRSRSALHDGLSAPATRQWRGAPGPPGEGHLRAAVLEFVHHYHEERPHQGLGNTLIAPKMTVIGTGQMKRRQRLGGLLKFYYRQAA
jgi:transposase InsO family protein